MALYKYVYDYDYLTRKIVPKVMHNVLSGVLNATVPIVPSDSAIVFSSVCCGSVCLFVCRHIV